MTLGSLLSAAYQDCGYQSSPGSDVVARLTRYLNEGLQATAAEPGLTGLLAANEPLALTTVAGQARYVVPEAVSQILSITDRTNDRALSSMTLDEYRRADPDPSDTSGLSERWVPLGLSPVAKQPSDASQLFLLSTSASDTNTAYVEVVTANGYRRALSVAMTGTTAVSLSAAVTDIASVEDFYLSAAAIGTVTLLEDSGLGTELARITIGQTQPHYQAFYLWPTPSAAVTYYLDYRRELDLMVQTNDEPVLPIDFHPMLVKYAAFREWELKDDSRAPVARAQYDRWLSRLKYRLAQRGDTVPVLSAGAYARGRSRLGGWFPEDRW